jgi:hypothetical protein
MKKSSTKHASVHRQVRRIFASPIAVARDKHAVRGSTGRPARPTAYVIVGGLPAKESWRCGRALIHLHVFGESSHSAQRRQGRTGLSLGSCLFLASVGFDFYLTCSLSLSARSSG